MGETILETSGRVGLNRAKSFPIESGREQSCAYDLCSGYFGMYTSSEDGIRF